jgi:hypothetical protein
MVGLHMISAVSLDKKAVDISGKRFSTKGISGVICCGTMTCLAFISSIHKDISMRHNITILHTHSNGIVGTDWTLFRTQESWDMREVRKYKDNNPNHLGLDNFVCGLMEAKAPDLFHTM